MANGLYKASEIAVMTDDALDELLSYYSDTGNAEGVSMVRAEIAEREDDRAAAREEEYEHELREAEEQRKHEEMIDSMLAENGRWG